MWSETRTEIWVDHARMEVWGVARVTLLRRGESVFHFLESYELFFYNFKL